MDELRFLRYVVTGKLSPSVLVDEGRPSGERAGLELPLDEDSLLCRCVARGGGEISVGVSESGSTRSLEKAFGGMALSGSAGSDFSGTIGE